MLLMETQIVALEQLAQHCEEAVAQGQADDEAFEDTPEDFLDPLMDTLMLVSPSCPSLWHTVMTFVICPHTRRPGVPSRTP